MTLNPYESPRMTFFSGDQLPARFRVRNSRCSLQEYQNLCDSKIIGTWGWLVSRLTCGALDRQIVPAQPPFLDDLCDAAAIPERVRKAIVSVAEEAERLGFHQRYFSVARTTGIPVVGGAVRMLHPSGRFFLQAVASSVGLVLQGETHLVSAAMGPGNIVTFASSNGRPKYHRPPDLHAQYFRNAMLPQLLEHHTRWLESEARPFAPIMTKEQLAEVIDFITVRFVRWQMERGIFEPLA